MLTKRIIPCMDVLKGRVVKGTSFTNLRDAGDPVELGAFYNKEGADELVFLDIGATPEARKDWRLIADGVGIHWPQVDEDLSVEGLIRGIPSAEYVRAARRGV